MCHMGCSLFVPAGEHRIAVRCYGTPVVIGVARYCVGVTGVCRSVTRKDLQFGT